MQRVDRQAGSRPPFEARQVGVHHLFVPGQREDQRDIDANAPGNRLGDRGNAGLRRGNLDHHVVAGDERVQPPCLSDGTGRVLRQARTDLDADASIDPVRPLPNGMQPIARHLDVFDRQPVEDRPGFESLGDEQAEGSVVVVALGNGLLENGGIGCHADHAGVANERIKFTGNQRAAADEVQPDTLAEREDLFSTRGHERASSRAARDEGKSERLLKTVTVPSNVRLGAVLSQPWFALSGDSAGNRPPGGPRLNPPAGSPTIDPKCVLPACDVAHCVFEWWRRG